MFLLAQALAAPLGAQRRVELEVEQRSSVTLSRLELRQGGFYLLRAEHENRDQMDRSRIGVQLPIAFLGVAGHASVVLDHRPDQTSRGAAFEAGKGLPLLGGSIERGVHDFSGGYLILRRPNAELGMGGGVRDGAGLQHGALYLKGPRWSAAVGGAQGSDEVDYAHVAAAWQPAVRGGGPGVRFTAERRSSQRYTLDLLAADGATFSYLSVWGQYGMDQFPHRKSFEAVDDIMRYVLPPIFNHSYSVGRGVLGLRYNVVQGVHETTVDARVYPVRVFQRSVAGSDESAGRPGVLGRVLRSLMVGGMRKLEPGTTRLVGQLELAQLSVYGEATLSGAAEPYLFVHYDVAVP